MAADSPPDRSTLTPAARENIDLLKEFEKQDDEAISGFQAVIERISGFFGSPAYFAFVCVFVVLWIVANEFGSKAGWRHVDEPPFFLLQGIVSFNALLLTVAVLIRQNRMAQLAEHRAHLDLQINLLTEQKVTKLLQLVDQTRREAPASDLPPDPEAEELIKPADPTAILSAIKQTGAAR